MQDPAADHKRKIVEQFTLQAIPFAQLPGHSEAMRILLDLSGVSANDKVLDVACGPGLVACDFAPHAEHVTGIDITPGMIEQAKLRQCKLGVTNVSWQVGDVLPLPYPDDSFSLVLSRYSYHHFLEPAAALAEMVRVCSPGGRVMVVDVALPAEKTVAYNRMETLRDPSHVKALSVEQMIGIVADSGLSEIGTGWYKFESDLDSILGASFPNPGDEHRIRAMFEEDLGADRMGVAAHRRGEAIHYSVPILVVVGTKAGRDRTSGGKCKN